MASRELPRAVAMLGVTVERTRPSQVGPDEWSRIAGPWEIDYSYANMRAIESHPFNDSVGRRTFWWLVRQRGHLLGAYCGYVTETYNFATLFAIGWERPVAAHADRLYRWLDRNGLLPGLERIGVDRLVRLASGRIRVMFLGAHTADVGGQGIGPGFRSTSPDLYMPAIARMIDREAAAHAVEQITFREIAERDAGPFHFPDLWAARTASGAPVLAQHGFHRDPGFPAAYLDLREVAQRLPGRDDAIYRLYRHADAAEFLAYDTARTNWLTRAREHQGGDPSASLPVEFVADHPRASHRAETSRLATFRRQLFRAGIMPPILVELVQLERAEGELANVRRTLRRLRRVRSVADGLRGRIDHACAALPRDATPDVWLRAYQALERAAKAREVRASIGRRMGGASRPVDGSGAADTRIRDLRLLTDARRHEQELLAQSNPEFLALSSDVRRNLIALAAGRIRRPELEEQRLLVALSALSNPAAADSPAGDPGDGRVTLDRYLDLARAEADHDGGLRAVRRRIADLVRATGVAPEDADEARQAEELLIRSGGGLPSGVAAVLSRVAALRERRAEADASMAAGDERLMRESARLQRLLLGDESEAVRRELERAMVREFRREQDRIATDRGHGVAPRSADERRARLSAAVSYEPLDYPRLLRATEALRKVDRHRLLAGHRRHRADVRRDHPNQPGPHAPAFDAEGYFARGLWFSGRDERVWVNLADQDRITQLYHTVMAKSLIRHDVMTWPYYAAYRAAGRASRDELHFATLRVGGPAGPIVAAVTVKRSIAGHFRPERIALNGIDFGAYHALVILTIANELCLGGTFCSLGQTSQGTKLRDFGASFIDAHEYTAFRGLTARVFGLDRARRATFAEVHIDRILEIAALPPEERAEASRRHGIRWHI